IGARREWSHLGQMGVAWLFVYWIHVEIVYGVLSGPIPHRPALGQWVAAGLVFTAFHSGPGAGSDSLTDKPRLGRGDARPGRGRRGGRSAAAIRGGRSLPWASSADRAKGDD